MATGSSHWTDAEDQRLRDLVGKWGCKKWSSIAAELKTKGSKQCRRRWKNVIDNVNRNSGAWTPEEDDILIAGHAQHGNKWTEIAKNLIGRTDNAVKNRFHALTKAKGGDMGHLKGSEAPAHRAHTDLKRARDDPAAPHYERMMKQRHGTLPSSDAVVKHPAKRTDLTIVPPDNHPVELTVTTPKMHWRYRKSAVVDEDRHLLQEVTDMGGPVQFFPFDEDQPTDEPCLAESLRTPRFHCCTPGHEIVHALDDVMLFFKTSLTPKPTLSPSDLPTPRNCTPLAPLSPAHKGAMKRFFAHMWEEPTITTTSVRMPLPTSSTADILSSTSGRHVKQDDAADPAPCQLEPYGFDFDQEQVNMLIDALSDDLPPTPGKNDPNPLFDQ